MIVCNGDYIFDMKPSLLDITSFMFIKMPGHECFIIVLWVHHVYVIIFAWLWIECFMVVLGSIHSYMLNVSFLYTNSFFNKTI